MNFAMILYVLRYIICCEGILMLLPLITAFAYKESAALSFIICIALCILISFPFYLKRPKRAELHVREGFVTVALSWIVLSIIGAAPFVISGAIPNPVDALFESVSGFTTTGASILSELDSLPRCMLMWRSFTHWIGGMGVLVFILTVLPMTGGNHMNLMKAESPGPSVDKLVPKVQSTAKILYSIYVLMTVIQIIILIIGQMPVFDAVTLSFGTAGTGGFAVRNSGFADYSTFNQAVITVFMILFGVNFNVYFLILSRKLKKAFQNEEVITYVAIILVAIAAITVNTVHLYENVGYAIHHSAFQVGSIITTTGYSTVDFNLWPSFSKTILVLLMFMGACAGSTGGGIKVSRILILAKTVRKELHSFTHPKSVKKITFSGKQVSDEIVRSTSVYMVAYTVIFIASLLLISLEGKDLITTFTSVVATINNIGPGLELVGPTANFAFFSPLSKLVLIFDMLAGRLELFPMLLLIYKGSWKKF